MKGRGSHQKKRYDAEFKRESVRLADTSGKTAGQIERDLGLYPGAVGRWRKELNADPLDAFPGPGHQKPLEEENRQLRRELRIAQEERDILKNCVGASMHHLWWQKLQLLPYLYVGGATVSLLVAMTPLKNMVQGFMRT